MCITKIGRLVKKWGEGVGDTPLKMAPQNVVQDRPRLFKVKNLENY